MFCFSSLAKRQKSKGTRRFGLWIFGISWARVGPCSWTLSLEVQSPPPLEVFTTASSQPMADHLTKGSNTPFATFEVCSCYFRAVPDLHPVIFLDSSFCFHGVYLPLTIQSSIGSTTKHMINIFWGENKLYLPVLYQPWWWCWNLWWY